MDSKGLRERFRKETGHEIAYSIQHTEGPVHEGFTESYVEYLENLVFKQAKLMQEMDLYFCNICGTITPNPEGVCADCLEGQE